MNYNAWNTRLGDHFFARDSGGKRVFMCVTRDTLAEVSGLPSEDALRDFVAGVLEGPDWCQIRGCTLLETKVHCCLHIDPQWGQHWTPTTINPPGVNELQDLSEHVYWGDYGPTKVGADYPERYPPYLAYLAAFVLSWTERRPNRRGNDYYDTVLDLLDERRERWSLLPKFYRRYVRKGRDLTINDVWADLSHFCITHERAELALPTTILRSGRYVDTPKFFGLMKASDLRNLGSLFAAMEECGALNPEIIPSRKEFVKRVLGFGQRTSYISPSALEDLNDALQVQDTTLAEAYGRLFQAKYRDFDGLPEDEGYAPTTANQRTARLLRVVDRSGSIKVVCRLRSEGALKKLPLEEGVDYLFEGEGQKLIMRWVAGSEWFSPVTVPNVDLLGKLDLFCPMLRLKASMSAKNYIVMHNPSLYFLASCRVEVDELQRGRHYVLLANSKVAPKLDGISLVGMAIRCPSEMSCWSFSVEDNLSSTNWPPGLPSLNEESLPPPRLSFSGFRLESRSTRFPLGLPIRITCNVDNVQLLATGCDSEDIQQEDEGRWVLVSQKPGTITLSLREAGTGQPIKGWRDQAIFLEHLEGKGGVDRKFRKTFGGGPSAPPYPEVFMDLESSSRNPRCGGDREAKTFFASSPPTLKVVVRNKPQGHLRIFLGGKILNPTHRDMYSLPIVEAGAELLLEAKVDHTLLRTERLRFILEPVITVQCASPDRSTPTSVVNSLVATLRGDAGTQFDWEVREGQTRVTGGQFQADDDGVWKGMLVGKEHAGIKAGKTYEVRFGSSGKFTVSRWFKFRGRETANKNPLNDPHGGMNSIAHAFKEISLTVEKKGGNL